ncbi:hypothetical protein KQI72_12070 [Eubacterium sp. MSJ-21]|nr:hypothetical protein [Eubacterium sp. MSJ-21]
MALLHRRSDYNEIIHSDTIQDSVLHGQFYPVADLCRAGQYSDAEALLSKGYKCLHEDAGEEAAQLLHFLISNRHMIVKGKEDIPEILQMLYEEINEYKQTDAKKFRNCIQNMGITLADKYGLQLRRYTLPYMRSNMPDLYTDMIAFDDWQTATLMEFDELFVEENMQRLQDSGALAAYIEKNSISQKQAEELLLQFISCEEPELVMLYMRNLFAIYGTCMDCKDKNIYPQGFTCDVAIIATIQLFRIEMNKKSDVKNYDSVEEIDDFVEKLAWFKRLLYFHMRLQKEYSFDQVFRTLTDACTLYGDYEDSLNQLYISDIYLMNVASQFQRKLERQMREQAES